MYSFVHVFTLLVHLPPQVGHFYFEENKPATFIYPLYSLMGDMKMWFQLFTMQLEF